MNVGDLQLWLGAHGQPITVDGRSGPQTRAAIVLAFTNPCAPAVTDDDLKAIAARLGCSIPQLRAVSKVESGGAAFDKQGRPKILFERHIYYRQTEGRFGTSPWSSQKAGGYNEDSWSKLTNAAGQDVDAAFASASWGKFQVMGMHWRGLNYPSPLEMAYSTVTNEAAHYEMLARYIERFDLKRALAQLSTNPQDNVAFATGYNGPGFRRFDYHTKLAKAMVALL